MIIFNPELVVFLWHKFPLLVFHNWQSSQVVLTQVELHIRHNQLIGIVKIQLVAIALIQSKHRKSSAGCFIFIIFSPTRSRIIFTHPLRLSLVCDETRRVKSASYLCLFTLETESRSSRRIMWTRLAVSHSSQWVNKYQYRSTELLHTNYDYQLWRVRALYFEFSPRADDGFTISMNLTMSTSTHYKLTIMSFKRRS